MKHVAEAADQHWPVLAGQIRHLLGLAGGALVSKGYIGESDVEMFVGASVAILAMAWSVAQKRWGWGWKL